jgi:hypothetical protein
MVDDYSTETDYWAEISAAEEARLDAEYGQAVYQSETNPF